MDTVTEEILNKKLYFLCSVKSSDKSWILLDFGYCCILGWILLGISKYKSKISKQCNQRLQDYEPRKLSLIFLGRNQRLIDANLYSSQTPQVINQKPRAHSLVVSDLRPETKGSRFESGCYLRAEVSSLQ